MLLHIAGVPWSVRVENFPDGIPRRVDDLGNKDYTLHYHILMISLDTRDWIGEEGKNGKFQMSLGDQRFN
jgi:hypothetical protein